MSNVQAVYDPKKIVAKHALSESEHRVLQLIRRWRKKYGITREYSFWFVYDTEDRAVNWEGGWGLSTLFHFRNTYSILPNGHLIKNFVPSQFIAGLYECTHPVKSLKFMKCPLWSDEAVPFDFPCRCLADDGRFENDETCEWLKRL